MLVLPAHSETAASVNAPRWLRGALIFLLVILLSSCTVQDVQFRTDDRMQILSPESRALVSTPLTIKWSMRDFTAVGLDGTADPSRGAFVVFVDRAPMPAGRNLEWLARDDSACRIDASCPDEQYLAERGVHVSSRTSVRLETLPAASDGVGNEQHYVNIVLVDGTGRRIGESAWYRQFQRLREST